MSAQVLFRWSSPRARCPGRLRDPRRRLRHLPQPRLLKRALFEGPVHQDVLGKETLSRCRVYVEAMEHEVPWAGLLPGGCWISIAAQCTNQAKSTRVTSGLGPAVQGPLSDARSSLSCIDGVLRSAHTPSPQGTFPAHTLVVEFPQKSTARCVRPAITTTSYWRPSRRPLLCLSVHPMDLCCLATADTSYCCSSSLMFGARFAVAEA